MRQRNRALTIVVWAAVVIAAVIANRWQQSDEHAGRASARPEVTESRPEVRPALDRVEREQLEKTLALIERGGPFPYEKDGSVFQNREGRLPAKPRGYYREYTVPTPGARNRGARRIVRGEDGDTWYTRDHYNTFVRIE